MRVDGGREACALRTLPVEALRVGAEVADALREVGIERIGQLLEMPRSSLPARFGGELLRRLDQATGATQETIDPVRPCPPPRVERVFLGPATQLEAIETTVRELIVELGGLLEERESGVCRLVTTLVRVDAEPLRVETVLGRPSRDPSHLWALLAPRVATLNLGWGVERVMLTADRTIRIRWDQPPFVETRGSVPPSARKMLGEVTDTLANRLGADRVACVEPVESYVPERAFRLRPAREGLEPDGRSEPRGRTERERGRPTLLLERPEPIAVIAMTTAGPPSWLRWRGLETRVVASAGPERIAREWWRHAPARRPKPRIGRRRAAYADAYAEFMLGRPLEPGETLLEEVEEPAGPGNASPEAAPPAARDYFRVRDEQGRWLWVYHDLDAGGWFVHGVWA